MGFLSYQDGWNWWACLTSALELLFGSHRRQRHSLCCPRSPNFRTVICSCKKSASLAGEWFLRWRIGCWLEPGFPVVSIGLNCSLHHLEAYKPICLFWWSPGTGLQHPSSTSMFDHLIRWIRLKLLGICISRTCCIRLSVPGLMATYSR